MLNEEQLKAVNTIDGQMIIIACPGSGKTTTLLHRLQNMTSNYEIEPSSILMMTFTKAAAKEMEERYNKLEGTKKGVTFCTIHALCLAIIKKFGKLKNVIPEADARDVIFEALRNYPGIEDKNQFVNDIMLDISVHKNNPGKKFPLKSTKERELFQNFWNYYEDYKDSHDMIDFDDMLIYAYDLLLHNKEALDFMRTHYRYIQVDEYQDTNYIQRDIIYLIAGEHGNLAVVGDDDQSIYGFRGAIPEIMLSFKEDYPDAEVIRMGTNYRSCPEIVASAGKLIENNNKRYDKEFHANSKGKGKIENLVFTDRNTELEAIAIQIQQLAKQGNPDEIAVIYRTNKEAENLAGKMMRLGTRFRLNDSITSRYEHWIWNDILAFYRMANEKGNKNDLERTLNKPQRYLRAVNLPDKTGEGYYKLTEDNRKALKHQAFENDKEFWKMKKQAKEADTYMDLLNSLKGKSPKRFLFLLKTVYYRYLESYAEFRNADLRELTDLWEDFEADAEKRTWEEWSAYATQYNFTIHQSRKQKTGVTLTTMHRAKGLEWDTVYVIDCVEGITPFFNDKNKGDMEEERRLFYVAATRARKHLIFCGYRKMRNKDTKPSRFLSESGIQ